MPNLNAVLNEQIRRLAGREIFARTRITRKLTAHYRRDIAALKREVAALQKSVYFLEKQEKKRVAAEPVPEASGDVRFRADGLKSHRAKLGLSAKEYGRLVDAAGKTVYLWESSKSKPRQAQVAKLAAVRGIGIREALKRLELLGVSVDGKGQGTCSETAEEFITSLVKSRQATASSDINAAWRKSGRPGTADNTLSLMVSAKKLKRTKLKDVRGSKYSVA